MNREEAIAILEMDREEAIAKIIELGEKAEKYDKQTVDKEVTTPSGMKPVYEKPNHRKRCKRPGQKKGHPGITRQRPPYIDKKEEHSLEQCPNCGNQLGKPATRRTRIVEDIPPVKVEITEHTINGYWCPKCREIVEPTVEKALPGSTLGLNLIILSAWLHYGVGTSVSNVVKILRCLAGITVSPGGLTHAWQRVANILEPVYDAIGEKVQNSAFLHADETGWRVNGITHWLWCFANKLYCYYIIDARRGSPVLLEFFKITFQGILICDFWGAYNKLKTLAKQRCLYHLFTELVKVDKKNKSPAWIMFRKQVTRLLRDAIRLSQAKDKLDPTVFQRRKEKIYQRLDALIEKQWEDKDCKRLIKRLKRHRCELFTFLDHKEVSPFNNHAEQQMRAPVISRKISQQNRSDKGAKSQAIFMSLFRTCHLQKIDPIAATLDIVRALVFGKMGKDALDSFLKTRTVDSESYGQQRSAEVSA
ncbi:MAG TPA: IS66 family transposase [Thermodesulforhabdus norvegica]|uniref:IS66 family transposase n=1 Tax=Thermodesulforhabdus norvegica TaxID=39841 RepID=A0A7C0WSX3_9BACT|nr:IS66 family transposase [Thermodesulforhabdus norvegica]